MRASFGDAAENLRVGVAVNPVGVPQTRTHAAAGVVAVASGAIEIDEQTPSLADRAPIVSEGIRGTDDLTGRSGNRTNRNSNRRWRIALPDVARRWIAGGRSDHRRRHHHRTDSPLRHDPSHGAATGSVGTP